MDIRTCAQSVADVIGSLSPSLIGSAVAQAWKPALTFRVRFLQWVVGSTVSYYATIGIIEVTGWNSFAAQSIAFGIALVAFDATPRLMRAVAEILTSLPRRIADRYLPEKD